MRQAPKGCAKRRRVVHVGRYARATPRGPAHAAHNTIPRIKTFRRYPHLQATKPDGSPIRQRVDETTHAPRNVRYSLLRPATGGHSRGSLTGTRYHTSGRCAGRKDGDSCTPGWRKLTQSRQLVMGGWVGGSQTHGLTLLTAREYQIEQGRVRHQKMQLTRTTAEVQGPRTSKAHCAEPSAGDEDK